MAIFLRFIIGAPQIIVILFVIIISAIFTEFTSNLACASILFPILNSIVSDWMIFNLVFIEVF